MFFKLIVIHFILLITTTAHAEKGFILKLLSSPRQEQEHELEPKIETESRNLKLYLNADIEDLEDLRDNFQEQFEEQQSRYVDQLEIQTDVQETNHEQLEDGMEEHFDEEYEKLKVREELFERQIEEQKDMLENSKSVTEDLLDKHEDDIEALDLVHETELETLLETQEENYNDQGEIMIFEEEQLFEAIGDPGETRESLDELRLDEKEAYRRTTGQELTEDDHDISGEQRTLLGILERQLTAAETLQAMQKEHVITQYEQKLKDQQLIFQLIEDQTNEKYLLYLTHEEELIGLHEEIHESTVDFHAKQQIEGITELETLIETPLIIEKVESKFSDTTSEFKENHKELLEYHEAKMTEHLANIKVLLLQKGRELSEPQAEQQTKDSQVTGSKQLSRKKRSTRQKRLLGAFNFGQKDSDDRLKQIKSKVNGLLEKISRFERLRAKQSSLQILHNIVYSLSDVCPPNTNSLRVNSKCYEHVTNLWMDYDSALIYCHGRGGVLARPDLSDDHYLHDLRQIFPSLADNSVLIGITDIQQEGNFQFVDGSVVTPIRFYDRKFPVHANKDCVSLTTHLGYGLVDTGCKRFHEILCEYEPVDLFHY